MTNPDSAIFPIQASDEQGEFIVGKGLTKREYIATQVPAGLVNLDTAINPSEFFAKPVSLAIAYTDELLRRLEAE